LHPTISYSNFTSMNKFVRISTSLLLSLFILVSGSGLIIGKMVCLKSGYVQISANEVKDCCDNGKIATEFNDQCCAINNLAFQQQHFLGQDQLLIKASDVSSSLLLPEFQTFITTKTGFSQNYFSSSNPPGIITGVAALPMLCVFRV
jgi:hypothetical protein